MAENVVVLGSGYAGAGAIKSLEDELDGGVDLTWISKVDHHLVLHEAHRCIRDPSIEEQVAIPIEAIKSPATRFIHGEATGVDADAREIELDDGSTVSYDYLLVAIGSRTAFFGIDGLREHALTLKSLDDAIAIHDAITEAAREATREEPARIIVGGAGLSGIQSAGEIAAFRDAHAAPIDVTLVEGLDHVFPNQDPELQGALRKRLLERDVEIRTGAFIEEVEAGVAHVGEEAIDYDVLLWTGGITGRGVVRTLDIGQDERSHRINAESTFETSDERVFAIGDSALIEQNGDPAPPTAQAAWQAAEVAGKNLLRAVHGQPLQRWTHEDKGTLVSVGEDAVAHGVIGMPVETFGGPAARFLKKAIAARWINDVAGPARAARAWSDM
jgi:NADH dehydrogenase